MFQKICVYKEKKEKNELREEKIKHPEKFIDISQALEMEKED